MNTVSHFAVAALAQNRIYLLGENIAELILNGIQRGFQCIGILFAQRMKMQTVQKGASFICHGHIPLLTRDSETAARCAGVMDIMSLLRGAFRIDAKTDGFSCSLCLGAGQIREKHRIEVRKSLLHKEKSGARSLCRFGDKFSVAAKLCFSDHRNRAMRIPVYRLGTPRRSDPSGAYRERRMTDTGMSGSSVHADTGGGVSQRKNPCRLVGRRKS